MANNMKEIKRQVVLSGLTPILFDRYPGNNKEQLDVMDKIYRDGDVMVLPTTNILSFLSAINTESAPQRVIGRGYKKVCKAAQSFVTMNPYLIPFVREGKALKVNEAGLKVHHGVARVHGPSGMAIPNPKERPMLECPWELHFDLSLLETPDLNEKLLRDLFEKGGIAIGFGTFRGAFGKFYIKKWE
jgi:hypothetical protein